eukprot:2773500-Amphidinium_carterae.1
MAAHGGVEIVVVGLMRTGLQSLHKAFDILGYKYIYDQDKIATTYELWDVVLKNEATDDTYAQLFDGAEVVMGLPTFCFWEDILKVYPNAKVILTVRDEAKWWRSIKQAKYAMDHEVPGA